MTAGARRRLLNDDHSGYGGIEGLSSHSPQRRLLQVRESVLNTASCIQITALQFVLCHVTP